METRAALNTRLKRLKCLNKQRSRLVAMDLVLEHFREYDRRLFLTSRQKWMSRWPWHGFNSLERQLAEHPSFVFAEDSLKNLVEGLVITYIYYYCIYNTHSFFKGPLTHVLTDALHAALLFRAAACAV